MIYVGGWVRLKFLVLFLTVILGVSVISFLLYSAIYGVRDVSIKDVVSDSQTFDGTRVRLRGYVVDTSIYMFGPKYVLRNFEEKAEIALGGKGGPEKVNLEPYVSFVFDGENYTRIRDINASIVGIVRYIGLVTDAPPVSLDVEEIEPTIDALKTILTKFLNTTDVSKGGLYNVEILEVYEHKLGGQVVVINYTTVNAGHPHFMWEAIEHHTAVITLSEKGEVVSAFCVWGNFHDGRIWDLLNQRWIQQAVISEQQAIQTGRGFLDGIGYTTGIVLFTGLEEKTPNFYWHDLAGLEKPDVEGLRLCWVVRFEQAYRPGHFFEVWIDAYTGEVIGGTQCK